MPYIPKHRRAGLESPGIPQTAGELNYAITRLCVRYIAQKCGSGEDFSYTAINETVGALDCAKMELYRRIAAGYEDRKLAENGDAYTVTR